MRQLIATLFIGIVAIHSPRAQDHPALSRFTATLNDGKVYIQWTMRAGNTCEGLQVFRSLDSQEFIRIGLIPGICGSQTQSESYTHVDDQPQYNQVNYYRLELGLLGHSQVIGVYVPDFRDKNYQIIPHPLIREGVLRFDRRADETHRLTLHTGNGMLIAEQLSQADYFPLDVSGIPSGMLHFTIRIHETNEQVAKGQILIAH